MLLKIDFGSAPVVEGFTLPAKGTNGLDHIHTFRVGVDVEKGRIWGVTQLVDQSERHAHFIDVRQNEKLQTSGQSRGIEHKHEFVLFRSPLEGPGAVNPEVQHAIDRLLGICEEMTPERVKSLGYKNKEELVKTVSKLMKEKTMEKQDELTPMERMAMATDSMGEPAHTHDAMVMVDPARQKVFLTTMTTSAGDQHVHAVEAAIDAGPSFALPAAEGFKDDHSHIVNIEASKEKEKSKPKMSVIHMMDPRLRKGVEIEIEEFEKENPKAPEAAAVPAAPAAVVPAPEKTPGEELREKVGA